MTKLTTEQEGWVAEASRTDINGWIYLRIGGEPFARGFQHGYLVAKEWEDAIRVYRAMTFQNYGLTYDFFAQHAVEMHKDKIPEEIADEMKGIAAGLTAAGVPATWEDILAWNAYEEITGYWYPSVSSQYAKDGPHYVQQGHCSAFVATGSATADGKFVMAHTSFDTFWAGQYFNLMLDVTPTDGHRMVMQSVPGYIQSSTDFWVTDAGLVVTETTVGNFAGYDATRVPEYVRARTATQYAGTISEWVDLVNKDSNGGYANTWLLADSGTQEIASYEEGLIYQAFQSTRDGSYFGDNGPSDPRIMHLECAYYGYNDVRWPTGSRRVRWMQLLEQYHGRINREVGQAMIADTYDVYLGFNNPSMRTICSHFDQDPLHFLSTLQEPYQPFGSCDAKLATSDDVQNMSMWARYGRADGVAFDAEEHFRQHPQWAWQRGYLQSRPSQPWTYFDNGNTQTQTRGALLNPGS